MTASGRLGNRSTRLESAELHWFPPHRTKVQFEKHWLPIKTMANSRLLVRSGGC